MDGLRQASSSVERLRNFVSRLETEKFPAGETPAMAGLVRGAEVAFEKGLEDDLNTAQALAAVFDLVRDVNTAIDRSDFRQQDAPGVLAALQRFDQVLAVLKDEDEQKLHALGFGSKEEGIKDADIEALVNARQDARRQRNFKRADEIRQQLADNGIILEDTRDGGIRWKRK